MTDTCTTPCFKTISIDRLNWVRGFADMILKDMTDQQLVTRLADCGNHAVWYMGHTAYCDDMFRCMMTGADPKEDSPNFAKFNELFGHGSEPTSNVDDYDIEGVRNWYNEARVKLLAWVETLDEESAKQQLPEDMQMFAPDAASLPITIAAHEIFHLGQVSSVRASFNMPRLI